MSLELFLFLAGHGITPVFSSILEGFNRFAFGCDSDGKSIGGWGLRIFLVLTLLFPLTSCEKKEAPKNGKPTVLVSVPPYIYFVNKIAQGSVNVETLVPSGANPHIYEATPREVQRHQNAALWVYLGEPLDKKVIQFFRDSQQQIGLIDIARGIDLLSYREDNECATTHSHCQHHRHDEGHDLHIWLSPILAKQQARIISNALTALLPDQKEKFNANLQVFLEELDQLNQQIAEILSPMRGKSILVSHPAFGYFCRDYHLVQLSIEIEGKDPLPQHVTEILAKAKSDHIQSILTEPQYSNKGAELIAKSMNLPTHLVDPYAENYSENLLSIAKVIAQ
jgi:zinc transport system substrate-binding protein